MTQVYPICKFLKEKSYLNRFHSKEVNYLQHHADPLHHQEFAWKPWDPLPLVPSNKIGRYLILKTCKKWQNASNLVFPFCFPSNKMGR